MSASDMDPSVDPGPLGIRRAPDELTPAGTPGPSAVTMVGGTGLWQATRIPRPWVGGT